MAVTASQLSADDYLATPDARPRHTELIDGTVVVNEPKLPHAYVQTELIYRLRAWIEAGAGRGYVSTPSDVRIDDRNVFAPDVWWVGEHSHPARGQLDLDVVPDLVVEIRSPSTWARDLGTKLPAYEAVGATEAWYVDGEAHTVLVFRRSTPDTTTFDVALELGVGETLRSPMLPGFELPVATLVGVDPLSEHVR